MAGKQALNLPLAMKPGPWRTGFSFRYGWLFSVELHVTSRFGVIYQYVKCGAMSCFVIWYDVVI